MNCVSWQGLHGNMVTLIRCQFVHDNTDYIYLFFYEHLREERLIVIYNWERLIVLYNWENDRSFILVYAYILYKLQILSMLFNGKLHACGMCVLYVWFTENSDFTELFHWKTNPSNHYVPFLYADHDRYSTVPVEP